MYIMITIILSIKFLTIYICPGIHIEYCYNKDRLCISKGGEAPLATFLNYSCQINGAN